MFLLLFQTEIAMYLNKPSDSRGTQSEGFITLYKNYLQRSVRANKDLLNATSTASTCIRYQLCCSVLYVLKILLNKQLIRLVIRRCCRYPCTPEQQILVVRLLN